MKIRLFMNDYIDIYISKDGKVHVEIGKINEKGQAISENTYANSSFLTFMKYLGIDITDLDKEISEYISDNQLFIRIKRNHNNTGLDYNLHDIESKEELVSYSNFEDLINAEIFQIETNLN